jgi:VanZ family protein
MIGSLRSADTGTRLGLALLGYMVVVTLIVTLLPFQFHWPQRWRVLVDGRALDIAANVLLFVPLGFLYRLSFRRDRALRVLWIGALFSTAIEAVQLFEATREPSLADVAANTLGAWLGALAFDRIARSGKAEGRAIGWLALELPLMALTYLLVPLLWVSSLAGSEGMRSAIAIMPGFVGAILLGGMQRNYFGPRGSAKPRHTAAFAAVWLLCGAFPLLARHPLYLICAAAAVGALCWALARRPLPKAGTTRRFEVALLKQAAPVYAAYLVIIVVAPLQSGLADWSFSLGFPEIASNQLEILRLIELLAAFTLVGYMVAEFRGRSDPQYRDAVFRLLVWGVALTLATEAMRGYQQGYGASLARGMLLAGTVLYGGWLYHLQRAHVVRLLSGSEQDAQRAGR